MLKINVFGLVQGVGFRYFVQNCAKALGIKGTVENKGFNEVEAFAEGDSADLEILAGAIALGPKLSRVDEISVVEEENKGFLDFDTILPPAPLLPKRFCEPTQGMLLSPQYPLCDMCEELGIIHIYANDGTSWDLCYNHAVLFGIG